jgi:hypothetical protein
MKCRPKGRFYELPKETYLLNKLEFRPRDPEGNQVHHFWHSPFEQSEQHRGQLIAVKNTDSHLV